MAGGLERLLRDLDRAELVGDGLTPAVLDAINVGYPPRGRHAPRTGPGGAVDLAVESIAALASRPMPAPEWLARPIWPADAYGVVASAYKAGKTWMMLDLAVSVASGGRWCETWETPLRPVLVFLSEGGARKMLRRLRAVAAYKSVDLDTLPLRVSLRPPKIANDAELAALELELADHPPGLVVLDPWYLSAPGVRMAELVHVGEVLARVQTAAQSAGAALVVSHHWNQTGIGTGAGRFSGAGMAEWGRVLVSVDKVSEDGPLSMLKIEITGDEISPTTTVLRRFVEVDGDPEDLTAPFRYECGSVNLPAELLGRPNARTRVAVVLDRHRREWLDAHQIGDVLAGWGLPMTAKTIRRAAAEILEDDDADAYDEATAGQAKQWTRR